MRPAFVAALNDDVLRDAFVARHHESHAIARGVPTNDGRMRPFEHLDHHALAPSARVHAGDARHHAVTVHHLAHFTRREKQVLAFLLGDQEAETVGMSGDAPADHVHLAGDAVEVTTVLQNLAVALHGAQTAQERVCIALVLDAQLGRQRLKRQGFVVLGQQRQDGLAAGHGKLVFFFFPFHHGVLERFFRLAR